MGHSIVDYVWLDAEGTLRSKTRVLSGYRPEFVSHIQKWTFDGSSTGQANGDSSDLMLIPVRLYTKTDKSHQIALCEVYRTTEEIQQPHSTNIRNTFTDREDLWLGFEQEYVLEKHGWPLGFPKNGLPKPQGPYYCGVGTQHPLSTKIANQHMLTCLEYRIEITGTNAEVLLGQWEYQVLGMGAKKAADDLVISRYLLIKTAEKEGVKINFHPKPVKGDWNGSGMHVNFSTEKMRVQGGKELFIEICDRFRDTHKEHIAVYGTDNHLRLTGKHETASMHHFSYGESDRGCSIRIPLQVIDSGWKGYLEDRRPAANADPYKVTGRIVQTLSGI